MSDEKDTAASPVMSEDERAKLKELRAKEAEEVAAAAEEAAAKEAFEREAEAEEIANRPLFHVLIRNMARSPRTRTARAARSGHRRQGVLLDDGTRIRKQGRRRYTEVDLRTFANNHQRLLEYVRVGSIEVCDPKTERAILYEDLVELVKNVGTHLAERATEMNAHHEEAVAYYEGEALATYEKDLEKWTGAKAKADKAGEPYDEPQPEAPEPPAGPSSDSTEFLFNDSGVQLAEDVAGSTSGNAMADTQPPATGTRHDDTTLMDVDTSAVVAAVDQAEASKSGEANETPSERGDGEANEEASTEANEEEGLTEADLKKMNREQLDEVAKGNDLDPGEYSTKGDLIKALLDLELEEGEG